VTRWFVFETMTGTILREFEPQTGSWEARLNEAEALKVSLPLTDPILAAMDWRNLATPWKHSIAMDEGGRLSGGPILRHSYAPGSPLELIARGIRVWLSRRTILPPNAATEPLVSADGTPNFGLDTKLSGTDLGSLGRYLVWQACQWPGGRVPIVFEPARKGSRSRSYRSVELKNVDEALTQLSGVENGPDFDFRLRYKQGTSDTQVEWAMVSGTESQPRLMSELAHGWDLTAQQSSGGELDVQTDPTVMGSLSWSSAGRGNDSVLIARAYDPSLIDNGVPLLEIVDTSHTNVTVQSTLDGWAEEPLRTAKGPSEFWSFRARLDEPPRLRDYRVGDMCVVRVQGDPYVPDGEHRRRILCLSGEHGSPWVTITCGESFGG
jgi:hypothetical protein